TAIGMTDGMVVLSDRMDLLPPDRRQMVRRVHDLSGGRPEVLDLFDHRRPELIVSRRPGRLDIGVLNMSDRPRRTLLDLRRPELYRGAGGPAAQPDELVEFWTGARIPVRGGIADFGELPPHSARVVQIES
ncbi:MAG: hypothetical protein ACKOYM_10105, partial [Actinomycetes bacterium]